MSKFKIRDRVIIKCKHQREDEDYNCPYYDKVGEITKVSTLIEVEFNSLEIMGGVRHRKNFYPGEIELLPAYYIEGRPAWLPEDLMAE